MTVVTVHKAKTELSKLIARAEAGEEIIIARGSKPAVRLTPSARRRAGAVGEAPGKAGSWSPTRSSSPPNTNPDEP